MTLVDLRGQGITLSPEKMLDHLNSFELPLKFSAGIWCFGPSDCRFHAKYKPDLDIEGRLEIAAQLRDLGLAALEAHYPSEINEDNLELWKKFVATTGIRILTVVPGLFYDADFEWGSLSNPLVEPRRKAGERLESALRMNQELDTDFAVIWPGIDGYENPFGLDFIGMRQRFIEGLIAAMDAVPGVRIAFEPKPYEPRGHILFGTTSEGVLLGQEVDALLVNPENRKLLDAGHTLCCLNPEVGHVLMGYEDPAYAYSWPLADCRLAHIHLNSQPLGNYDQDLNAGLVSPEQLEALIYTLRMYGYTGYFGLDINPERMPVKQAMANSIDAVRAAHDRVANLDHESILFSHTRPDKNRGWLEAYMTRQRAARPELLSPLPPVEKD